MRILFAAMVSMAGATSAPLRDTANLKAGLEALQKVSDSLKGNKAPEALLETEATAGLATFFKYMPFKAPFLEPSYYCEHGGVCAGWLKTNLAATVAEITKALGMPSDIQLLCLPTQYWYYTWDYEVKGVTGESHGRFLYACSDDAIINDDDRVLFMLDLVTKTPRGFIADRDLVTFNFDSMEPVDADHKKLPHRQDVSIGTDFLQLEKYAKAPEFAYAWSHEPAPGAYVYYDRNDGEIVRVWKLPRT